MAKSHCQHWPQEMSMKVQNSSWVCWHMSVIPIFGKVRPEDLIWVSKQWIPGQAELHSMTLDLDSENSKSIIKCRTSGSYRRFDLVLIGQLQFSPNIWLRQESFPCLKCWPMMQCNEQNDSLHCFFIRDLFFVSVLVLCCWWQSPPYSFQFYFVSELLLRFIQKSKHLLMIYRFQCIYLQFFIEWNQCTGQKIVSLGEQVTELLQRKQVICVLVQDSFHITRLATMGAGRIV